MDASALIAGVAGTAKVIRDLVDGKQSKEVLRERLLLAADRLDLAQEQISNLEAKLAAVTEEFEKLRERHMEIEAEKQHLDVQMKAQAEFAEVCGILVRRDASGRFSTTPYCPTCRNALSDMGDMLACGSHGGFVSQASAGQIVAAVARLNG